MDNKIKYHSMYSTKLTSKQKTQSLRVTATLQNNSSAIQSIVPEPFASIPPQWIDFERDYTTEHNINLSQPEELEIFINDRLFNQPGKFIVGGYDTDRTVYQSDLFLEDTNPRDVHLAYDIWLPPETPLHSPLPAMVYGLHNNNHHLDYGPTVILQHIVNSVTFWSLYGHLQTRILEHLSVGQHLAAGDVFGWIGYPYENIGWAPHTHAQIITDLLGNTVDFPGLCSVTDRTFFTTICPDPGLLFKFAS